MNVYAPPSSRLISLPSPAFNAPYAEPDEAIVDHLMADLGAARLPEHRIRAEAEALIRAIRERAPGLGGVEDFLKAYSLTTKEGLALMVLAEALLRVPDDATADRLIEDKISGGQFSGLPGEKAPVLVSASAWALGITARIIGPGETPDSIFHSLVKRLGQPAVRVATRQAMRFMGHQFVLGETIEAALSRARSMEGRGYRHSYDMLGEGARTHDDAERYFAAYSAAIEAIGKSAGSSALPARPGISVKLSALHPRYEAMNEARVLEDLPGRVLELARAARDHNLNFTVDAEEADRLELSLDVIARVVADTSLGGWEGFGLAVQAYQKRAGAVIDWLEDLGRAHSRRFMVRLVKGAYWDTEIKRAQERGLADYPVFTAKAATDLSYLATAHKMLAASDVIYPQFATHNALTVAAIREMAETRAYEFQRLHGMGETLYAEITEKAGIPCRIYAPVGSHRDLLAYLVRRLLENGANSSFVSKVTDPAIAPETLTVMPAKKLVTRKRHAHLGLPRDMYPDREAAPGLEFGHRATREKLLESIAAQDHGPESVPVLQAADIDGMMNRALPAARAWNAASVDMRASTLERYADLMLRDRDRLMAVLVQEAGKTLPDALSEVREAVDFCRYYARQARLQFRDVDLPGPTGESNRLRLRGRGVFACISPWNFPLAIFTGQIVAALVAGNAVIAKPAEETPHIAALAVGLMHEAGIPQAIIQLAAGGRDLGQALVEHPRLAGVAFTGSTATAKRIQRTLAAKDGAIVPLIAETGGLNAMIVDATALLEQVTDDVMISAFRSAGQRCSALRLLCVQEDVADKLTEMLKGAAAELAVGNPAEAGTDLGPVISATAKAKLDRHIAESGNRVIFAGKAPKQGNFVAPHIIGLNRVEDLTEEHFGPVLHVVRYGAHELDKVLEAISASGYGLTLGVATRIDETVERIISRLDTGNIYVNRNMIGAVVGSQPFGGSGLSGTGPKAGGPHYLARFALEQVITVNTAAAGGNVSLVAMSED